MRLPNSKDMSTEQKRVYLNAPLDGEILVSGPPGTGKTVIAFLRAETLARKKQSVTVVMYNRVLQTYTKNATSESDVNVKTRDSWLWNWWEDLAIASKEEFELDCPFSEKDKAKELGAHWKKSRKKWWVKKEKLDANPSLFSRWSPRAARMELPLLRPWVYDWAGMAVAVLANHSCGSLSKETLHWGSLIIDEAQDFPKEMYTFFALLKESIFKEEKQEAPSITILADENQRLNAEVNSTISEIRKALTIPAEREYKLTRNYRNTRSIAALAKEFYVGLPSGVPDMPQKGGDTPVLFEGSELRESIDFMARYARNHDNEQIGVIVQSDRIRKNVYNKLKHALSDSSVGVQTYGSKDPAHNDASSLKLDDGGWVAVVNKQSCKGLEFDAVFLPELQSVSMDASSIDQFKMEMYVMCSRARTFLALMYSNEGESLPQFLDYLPRDSQILERI